MLIVTSTDSAASGIKSGLEMPPVHTTYLPKQSASPAIVTQLAGTQAFEPNSQN